MSFFARTLARNGLRLTRQQTINDFQNQARNPISSFTRSFSSANLVQAPKIPFAWTFAGTGLFAFVGLSTYQMVCAPVAADSNDDNDNSTVLQKVQSLVNLAFSPVTNIVYYINEEYFADKTDLMDPLPPDQAELGPKTVVLGLEQTLVYMEWTRSKGWVVLKRPGLDRFLAKLHASGFEVILWASKSSIDVQSVANDLDNGLFKKKMFSHDQNFKDGHWVKDLRRLNRDLNNVMVIDAKSLDSCHLNPENALNISKWTGNLRDTELTKISMFLEEFQKYNVADVRDAIARYNADPTADHFATEREIINRYTHGNAEKKKAKTKKSGSSSSDWLAKIGGIFKG